MRPISKVKDYVCDDIVSTQVKYGEDRICLIKLSNFFTTWHKVAD